MNELGQLSQSIKIFILFIVAILLSLPFFKGTYITVDPNQNKVIAVETSWWGFSKHERQIKWMYTDPS